MQARKANSTEAVAEWEEKPVKQYNEMISQFDLMLKNIKTPLNIIRVDLSTSEDSTSTKCLNRLANALNNLQNNCINKKIPVSTKGLVWHLEYQERKGFHYQCVFFCDNKDDISEEDIFTTLSEHWKYTILRGKGSVFNCSDEASLLRGKGIGLQDFSNQLVYNLFIDEILPMLTLVDKDLRLRTPQELLKSTHTSHMNFESNGYWFDISKK
ncbi:hypothetical protein VI06_21585 [Aquitalea magnusonii]|nr:hypothetical protein VI06_21585 [Aquitalea magnusonii]